MPDLTLTAPVSITLTDAQGVMQKIAVVALPSAVPPPVPAKPSPAWFQIPRDGNQIVGNNGGIVTIVGGAMMLGDKPMGHSSNVTRAFKDDVGRIWQQSTDGGGGLWVWNVTANTWGSGPDPRPGTTPPVIAPPTTAGTPKANLLARFQAIKGIGFILSQQCHSGLQELNSVKAAGMNPGMIWTDPWPDGQPAGNGGDPNVAGLIQFAKAGGVVGVSTAIPNPVTGGGANDQNGIDPAQMITPGTGQYNAFVALADRMAEWLKPLEDAGIAYLHRFLLEADMGGFWYNVQGRFSADQYAQLFAIWTNRLRSHGLNNMVTVWATNGNRTDHFPGPAVTDITGWDYYGNNPGGMTGHYNALRALGLPVAMTEFGSGNFNNVDRGFDCQALIDAWKQMPEVAWCNFWTGWEPSLLSNNGVLARSPVVS